MLAHQHRPPEAVDRRPRRRGARSATSAPESPGSERSPSPPIVDARRTSSAARSAPANGATSRRGPRPLRRPPRDHLRARRHVRAQRRRAGRRSSVARCAACSPATARAGPSPAWSARSAIMALFAVLVGCRAGALGRRATGSQPDVGAIEALWALHNSVFTVLLLSIGVALLGSRRAGVAAGITPRAFDRLAPVGCALLARRQRSAGPSIAARRRDAALRRSALVGFLIWLAFLVTTGLRLVRRIVAEHARSHRDPPTPPPPRRRRAIAALLRAAGAGLEPRPTARRSAPSSPTTPTSSTSAAPITAATPRSATATRRSSTRSTPAARSATSSTSARDDRPGMHRRRRPGDARRAERAAAAASTTRGSRRHHRAGRWLGGRGLPEHAHRRRSELTQRAGVALRRRRLVTASALLTAGVPAAHIFHAIGQ